MIKVHKEMKSFFICANMLLYTYIFDSDFVSAHIGYSFSDRSLFFHWLYVYIGWFIVLVCFFGFFYFLSFPYLINELLDRTLLYFQLFFFFQLIIVYNNYTEKDLFTNEAFKAFDGECETKLFLGIPQAFVNAIYGCYRCMFDNRMKHVFFFKRATGSSMWGIFILQQCHSSSRVILG